MKKLQILYTSEERSRRLLEIQDKNGYPLDPNSADMFYRLPDNVTPVVIPVGFTFKQWCGDVDGFVDYSKYVPCWSVGRLTEILNICSLDDDDCVSYFPGNEDYCKRAMHLFENRLLFNELDFSLLNE